MMKTHCLFMQALCLTTLILILTCESRSLKNECKAGRIMKHNENLFNKTAEFKRLFPDNIINKKLLTEALKNDFMQNCTTRLDLMSFYSNEVLSVGKVLKEAEKYGINEDFSKIEDMMQICAIKCELNEETEAMKTLRHTFRKINKEKRLHKAVSEMNTLLKWINLFFYESREKVHSHLSTSQTEKKQ